MIKFKDNSKAESVCEFLEEIKMENQGERILLVLDNYPSHKAKKIMEKAEDLGIGFVFLPSYSPDLKPHRTGVEESKTGDLHNVLPDKGGISQHH